MWSSFVRAIVVLSLVGICGYYGGPNGACVGAGLGYALHSVFTIIGTCRATTLSATAYLAGTTRPLLPCVPMFFAVLGIAHALAVLGVPQAISLAAQIGGGAVVYVGAAFVLVRRDAYELLRIGREAIGRRRR